MNLHVIDNSIVPVSLSLQGSTRCGHS